jgi:hypothetical protein
MSGASNSNPQSRPTVCKFPKFCALAFQNIPCSFLGFSSRVMI